MKNLLTFIIIIFYLKANCQHNDTIRFIREKGSYWSPNRSISEELILIIDTNKKVNFKLFKYKINVNKSTKEHLTYDTIIEKGNINIEKLEVQNILYYLDTSIEKDNTSELKNLISNASYSDSKKIMKIKSWDLSYSMYFDKKLDEDDYEEFKKELFINEYLKYLEKNKKSFSFTYDVTNTFLFKYKKNNIEITLSENFLDNMGQPYYIFKENDSSFKRYINIETNSKLIKLLNKFENFKECLDYKRYLNTYILWFLKNSYSIKYKNKK